MTLEPPDYLQPDERVLLEARPEPRSIAPGLVATTLLAAGIVAVLAFLQSLVWPEAAPWLLAVGAPTVAVAWLAGGVVRVVRMRTSRYVITDTRLYRSHGRFRFHLVQTTYDKLTDLNVVQGPLGRALGYGSVAANTAGAAVVLPGIPRPFEVKQQIEEARSAFLRKLVGAHKRSLAKEPATSGKSSASHATAPAAVWSGSPTALSLLGRLLRAGLMVMAGLFASLLIGSDGTVPGIGLGGLFILFGLGLAISAFLAYRYSRYEVTSAGVVVSTGWLSRRRVETTFSKVTDVTTTQTLLGRLLGYGDIRINTAGSTDVAVAFNGVARPLELKALIDQARGAWP